VVLARLVIEKVRCSEDIKYPFGAKPEPDPRLLLNAKKPPLVVGTALYKNCTVCEGAIG
jgi:hypothetical protein